MLRLVAAKRLIKSVFGGLGVRYWLSYGLPGLVYVFLEFGGGLAVLDCDLSHEMTYILE